MGEVHIRHAEPVGAFGGRRDTHAKAREALDRAAAVCYACGVNCAVCAVGGNCAARRAYERAAYEYDMIVGPAAFRLAK